MKKVLFIAALIGITTSGMAQKAYNLQFKPKQGEKYDAITNTKSSIKQSMMGQEMVIDMNYDVNMLYEVVKAAENTSLNMTYDKLEMDMSMMGQNIKMSSDDPDNSNDANKPFKALKGGKISVIVSPDGKVVDIQGAEDLANRIGDASPAEKETLKAFVSKDNLRSMTEQSFGLFPGKPVKIGDSWKKAMTIESPYKLTSDNTYKLIKVENGLAYIDVNGIVSTGGAQKMTANGMEMTVELTGDQQGTMSIDEATGIIKEFNVAQNLKGKMEVMGQEVPMEIKSDTNTKMVKK